MNIEIMSVLVCLSRLEKGVANASERTIPVAP